MCGTKGIVQTPLCISISRFGCDQVNDGSLRDRGRDAARAQNRWRGHLSGRRDHSRTLWTVLMMQSWVQAMAGYGTSRSADTLERPP
jgi:asparagine synthase (glutamine-hydrolysing)